MKAHDRKLTKADTVALWHAVQAMKELVVAMRTMSFTPEQKAAEQQRLNDANRALRKVNRIRRQQGAKTDA